MSSDREQLEKSVTNALTGRDAHVENLSALEGLAWQTAGIQPQGAPHTIFQVVNHMTYWQEWAVKWLDGDKPPIPTHAPGSWPGTEAPANETEWQEAVQRFKKALQELTRRSREMDLLDQPGKRSRLEMLQLIGSHNSYHSGQVVLLRQMLGAWPPPSGGLTW